ncbi:DNA repair protein RAD50 [Holothuria leucospilota]|uniref:DNA repair protein RAD50 n=1 Tax=Holothuria leucospilota TaxID=206669 RepID=A0A9Q1BRP9_HOLLE|nr:DNA repair protein RAD50 [Holothuria leucospilota]
MHLKMKLESVEENLRSCNTTIQMEEENVKTLKQKESMVVKMMPNICKLDYYLKVVSKRETDIASASILPSTSEKTRNSMETMDKKKQELQRQIRMLSEGLQKLAVYFGDIARLSSLPEKLQTNSLQLKAVKDDISQLQNKIRFLDYEIEGLAEDIKYKSDRINKLINSNFQLQCKLAKKKTVEEQLCQTVEERRKTRDLLASKQTKEQLEGEISDLQMRKSAEDGRLGVLEEVVEQLEDKLNEDRYRNVDENYRACVIDLKTTEIANKDLEKFYNALDSAVIEFHKIKMEEINRIIYEYWTKIYKGNDIDFIEVRSEAPLSETSARRSYNYKVVMVSGGIEMDMRGHCSAGQMVLASLIIRLALAETFCLSCGVLALDEPTANLDYENKQGLASALTEIIDSKMEKYKQNSFQLIVITHDEAFVEMLEGSGYADHFYRVTKDDEGNSIINRKKISELQS